MKASSEQRSCQPGVLLGLCLRGRARMLWGCAAPQLAEPNSCWLPGVRVGLKLEQKGGICSQAHWQWAHLFLRCWHLAVHFWKAFATHKQLGSPIPELQALILHLVRRLQRCCLPSFCLFACSLPQQQGLVGNGVSVFYLILGKMALQKTPGPHFISSWLSPSTLLDLVWRELRCPGWVEAWSRRS